MKVMSVQEYDRGWDHQWDDMKSYGPMARHIRRNIIELVRPLEFQTVMDIGCGQGALLSEIHAQFPDVDLYGSDISSSAIKLASQRVSAKGFWTLDIAKENLDQQFDLIVCSEVLEHIPDDVAAIRNIARMTERYLVISTVQGRMRRLEPEAWGHVRNYARGELATKVEQSGLRVVEVIEWGFPFYSPLYRNLIALTGGKGTSGKYGIFRRMIASMIYALFMLNSSRRGDEIIILAEKPQTTTG
jgi:SAM-dependent methyltransferase